MSLYVSETPGNPPSHDGSKPSGSLPLPSATWQEAHARGAPSLRDSRLHGEEAEGCDKCILSPWLANVEGMQWI